MSDTPTYESVLINRLSTRLGQMAVTLEMQQLHIESLTQCLRDNGVDPETLQPLNGHVNPADDASEIASGD